VSYRLANGDPESFLAQLADAVAAPVASSDETALPGWTHGEPIILYRHPRVISIFEELNIANGRLTARHPALGPNQALARRMEHALRVIPGVIEAATTEELRVLFDPHAVTGLQLIRIAEAEILGQPSNGVITVSEPVNFGLENIMVGVAAVGEFVLPLAGPIASGLLVLASLGTFGTAASQLRDHRIGLPLLYSCAVGARLSSGQFFAASLIGWFFRYWEYRYRQDVEVEIKGLIDDAATLPKQARVLAADGLTRLVPSADIVPGQQVRVFTDERVPVDGRVLTGTALVDESLLGGPPEPVRRVVGDLVFTGSRLLAGAFDIETLRTGDETRAARIAHTLIETMVPRPHSEALNQDAEDFAGQTVAPTLLTASAGLILGDVTTAGTILSPDYATGAGLAMPLERVRDVRSAIRVGAVIRTSVAFERLAKTSWFVLDDHEALHRAGCEVAEVRTKGFDESRLLPAMAAAGIWLGDERGPAIARACCNRGLVVRRAVLHEIDADGVAIEFGDHLVRLRGRPVAGGAAPPPLTVEVNGVEVAGIRFVRNGYLEAADAVRSLRRNGRRVFLTSQSAAAGLADALGVDRYGEGMGDDDKVRVLRDLRQQGLAAAYVGDGLPHAPAAREAHLSISLGGGGAAGDVGSEPEPSDIVLMSPSISSLPALCALARDGARRRERARYAVMVPNLLCVAGAFAFGFTPMAAVLLSNFGTSVAYNGAKRALREADPMRLDDAWYAERTRPQRAEIRAGG
jgi:cation transport ATPase